jgi:hypothetical protein
MQPLPTYSTTSEGHPLLVLRGEEGAVSVEGWRDPESGTVVGMLTVHSAVPHAMRFVPEECNLGGHCYPLFADWKTNFTAAEYLVRGGPYLRLAEWIALTWYIDRLCPSGVLSS